MSSEIQRGIKQGDGLSPIIISIGLEGILKIKNWTFKLSIRIEVVVLTFTDNIAILVDKKEKVRSPAKLLINKL